ncbi:MAG: hypothetical protein PHE54_01040 [Bacilli bacterium]|nr:hypothetical protein [Bacilli bacterium]
MKEALISSYVNRLTYQDVDNFARQQGIILKKTEIEIIYNHIKGQWRTIIYGNPRGILDDIKDKFDSLTYNKIEQLYYQFKNKFQDKL